MHPKVVSGQILSPMIASLRCSHNSSAFFLDDSLMDMGTMDPPTTMYPRSPENTFPLQLWIQDPHDRQRSGSGPLDGPAPMGHRASAEHSTQLRHLALSSPMSDDLGQTSP